MNIESFWPLSTAPSGGKGSFDWSLAETFCASPYIEKQESFLQVSYQRNLSFQTWYVHIVTVIPKEQLFADCRLIKENVSSSTACLDREITADI